MRHVIGVDVGGTTMKAALLDERGRILVKGWRETKLLADPQTIFERIADLVSELRENATVAIEAVGIGIPGPFNVEKGISVHSPNLNWKNVDVRTPLAQLIDLPLFFENDLRTATIGEAVFGAAKGIKNVIFVPLGTGVGAGIILNGTLFHGAHGFSGEIGHVPLPFMQHVRCNCGKWGCVETIASATGIARLAREKLEAALQGERQANQSPLYQCVGGDLDQITARHVSEAARTGDEVAMAAWHEACQAIGWSLAVLINLFDPEKVVIGGGVSNAGDFLLQHVKESVGKQAMAVSSAKAEICLSGLGAEPARSGAGVRLHWRGLSAGRVPVKLNGRKETAVKKIRKDCRFSTETLRIRMLLNASCFSEGFL